MYTDACQFTRGKIGVDDVLVFATNLPMSYWIKHYIGIYFQNAIANLSLIFAIFLREQSLKSLEIGE